MRSVRILAAVFVVLLVIPAVAKAQSVASVTGTVTDKTGATVPGAAIKVLNTRTNATYFGKTAGDGTYRIVDLPPGPGYALTYTKDGFQTFVINGLYLPVNTATTQDVRLEVGTLSERVEVTAHGAGSLNTTDASIGTVVEGDRVQDLPSLFVDNAANLLALAPGVLSSGDDSQQGVVTGSRGDQTNITLDGLDVNDQRNAQAFTTVVNTPIDSVQEVKTIVGGNDASFGHSAGGQVELVTKSGTNQFHGAAYEFNRVTALAANNFFNNLNGVSRPGLIRNQFGGDVGGPIYKDKLFFFFAYNALRSHSSQQITDIVPLDPALLQSGRLNYVHSGTDVGGAPCNRFSNVFNQPTCISTTPASGPGSLQAIDPAGIGANSAVLSLLNSRYTGPVKNSFIDPSVGDLVNTIGLQFVEPVVQKDNTFVGRLDFQATKNHRLFGRATWNRVNDDDAVNRAIAAFPGDPTPEASIIDHSRSWVVGDTWTVSPSLINEASFGVTDEVIAFILNQKPPVPSLINFFAPNTGNVLTAPFNIESNGNASLNEQFVDAPVYQLRDSITWSRGKHTLQFGGVIKPVVFKSGNVTDTNLYEIGLGGNVTTLVPGLRPADIAASATQQRNWDNMFALTLGRVGSITSGYNYDLAGNPQTQGTVPKRDYHATEYEFYGQDVWNVRPGLTATLGLRWQFHKPLAEINGFQAIPSIGAKELFAVRQANAAAGIEGPDAAPLVSYSLGGPKNNAPGYYKPQYTNFAPRIGIAYSPSFSQGFLGRIFGDRKSSIRAGFGINYDESLIGQGFELDELSFLFSNSLGVSNGGGGALAAFAPEASGGDPRFTGITTLPPPAPTGNAPRPTFTPNVDENGFPIGFNAGGFGLGQAPLFNFDPHYKTPYEMSFSFGFQREFGGDWLVDVTYFGKMGRKLTALGDPAQTLNFKDAQSGHFLYTDFGALQSDPNLFADPLNVTPQLWFENQMNLQMAAMFGTGETCQDIFGVTCTGLIAANFAGPVSIGDVSSTLLDLANVQLTGDVEQGLIPVNNGLLAQDGAAGFIGNFSSSSYNALLVRLNHRLSHNFTLEFDYAYSHSIDNDSDIQNNLITFAAAEVCDLRNLRVCRGNSNFDATHVVAANFDYGLPFGRGQWLGRNSSKLLDELIGGWKVSGIFFAHSGFPFKIETGSFAIDFTQTAPAVFVGTQADVKGSTHVVTDTASGISTLQFFKDPARASSAFQFPFGGGGGDRNVVRGPGFVNTNFALLKNFSMPWSESQKLQFRAEAFNLFNHANFAPPADNAFFDGNFGAINQTANSARQFQFALKYTF